MITIKGLKCHIKKNEILKGLDLTIKSGETHVIMGKNGCGKSTLLHTLMGNPSFKVTEGEMCIQKVDITRKEPHLRAGLGMFLSFQSPYEFFETTTLEILTRIWNKKNNFVKNTDDFISSNSKLLKSLMIDDKMLNREFNVGFSGGERKRLEVLQMMLIQPKIVLLDEIDTGLDIDSIISIGNTLKEYQKKNKCTMIIVTHLANFLKYIPPNKVHVMNDGKIVKSGKKDLADKINNEGYSFIK